MELIYITNSTECALVAESAGVDHVMIDLEFHGKEARQGHHDTVISRHERDDISRMRSVLTQANLLVRVNPIFEGSNAEIEDCIARGADRLMLPMFTTAQEGARFIEMVGGRARTCLLLETPTALARLPEILDVPGVENVHMGLNDLHLGLKLDFMFEVLAGGLVEYAAKLFQERGVPFGFGGVARLDTGLLPANLILSEHARLGSEQVILSRDFGDIFDGPAGPEEATEVFTSEVAKLRTHWAALRNTAKTELIKNQSQLRGIVEKIAAKKRAFDQGRFSSQAAMPAAKLPME